MNTALRFAGIALMVLVLAIVFTVCGEGLCVSCAHACCVKSDRIDRLHAGANRLFAAFAAPCGEIGAISARSGLRLHRTPGALAYVRPPATKGLPLRT